MAKKGNMMVKVGSWAFIVGVLLAILIGMWPNALGYVGVSVLILLGIVVGLLNITAKETMPFLVAVIALLLVGNMGGEVLSQISMIGVYLSGILHSIMIFVIPATIIVALKTVYSLAENE